MEWKTSGMTIRCGSARSSGRWVNGLLRLPRSSDKGGFNVEQLCHVLEEQSLAEIYDPVKHAAKLSRYISESRKLDVRLIIYFNVHCVFPGVIGGEPVLGADRVGRVAGQRLRHLSVHLRQQSLARLFPAECGSPDAAGSGRIVPSLADAPGIDEIMSVHHYGNGCGYLDIEDPELLLDGGVAPLTGGFGTALQCTYQAHAEILASMHVPMAGSYDAFPAGKFASVTRTAYGKGKSLYFAGDLEATMTRHGLVELKRMVSYLLNHSMDSDLAVTHAYGSLEVEMREQPADRRRLIHFVNYTGQMQRPIDRIIPCHDIEVFIRTTKPILSVHLLQADVPADFTISAEGIVFTVPTVEIYELAVVQFG